MPAGGSPLGELAERADVLPLSFHVTYWDRLGWPDSFGLADSTRRQEAYADRLGLDRLYTPQMMIGGRIDIVGSARGRVLEAVGPLRSHAKPDQDWPSPALGCRSAPARGRCRDLAGRLRSA